MGTPSSNGQVSGKEQTILVHAGGLAGGGADKEEFRALARAAGAEILGEIEHRRLRPDPRYCVGAGKAEEVATLVRATEAKLVIVNEAMTPAQERNLEGIACARVLDRKSLILDIFAQRARSFEGRLAVERAQLKHLSTRLVRGWTHLERQKGGIGLRGPGETQLETDRRLIGKRLRQLASRLQEVELRRARGRNLRRRNEVPLVALVGYTNAGKTTLFNKLTQANAYSADKLFATLDPLLRRVDVPGLGPVVLADTVGFVSDLPHELIEAFTATLSEAREADLLLHVIDASDEQREEHIRVVNQVLVDIGCDPRRQLEIYNKIDQLTVSPAPRLPGPGRPERIGVSARDGIGMDNLLARIGTACGVSDTNIYLEVEPEAARIRSRLFALNAVVQDVPLPTGGWKMAVRLRESALDYLCRDLQEGVVHRCGSEVG